MQNFLDGLPNSYQMQQRHAFYSTNKEDIEFLVTIIFKSLRQNPMILPNAKDQEDLAENVFTRFPALDKSWIPVVYSDWRYSNYLRRLGYSLFGKRNYRGRLILSPSGGGKSYFIEHNAQFPLVDGDEIVRNTYGWPIEKQPWPEDITTSRGFSLSLKAFFEMAGKLVDNYVTVRPDVFVLFEGLGQSYTNAIVMLPKFRSHSDRMKTRDGVKRARKLGNELKQYRDEWIMKYANCARVSDWTSPIAASGGYGLLDYIVDDWQEVFKHIFGVSAISFNALHLTFSAVRNLPKRSEDVITASYIRRMHAYFYKDVITLGDEGRHLAVWYERTRRKVISYNIMKRSMVYNSVRPLTRDHVLYDDKFKHDIALCSCASALTDNELREWNPKFRYALEILGLEEKFAPMDEKTVVRFSSNLLSEAVNCNIVIPYGETGLVTQRNVYRTAVNRDLRGMFGDEFLYQTCLDQNVVQADYLNISYNSLKDLLAMYTLSNWDNGRKIYQVIFSAKNTLVFNLPNARFILRRMNEKIPWTYLGWKDHVFNHNAVVHIARSNGVILRCWEYRDYVSYVGTAGKGDGKFQNEQWPVNPNCFAAQLWTFYTNFPDTVQQDWILGQTLNVRMLTGSIRQILGLTDDALYAVRKVVLLEYAVAYGLKYEIYKSGRVTGKIDGADVDVAGHLINMLLACQIHTIDIHRYWDTVEHHEDIKFAEFAIENFEKEQWHTKLEYYLALQTYVQICRLLNIRINSTEYLISFLRIKRLDGKVHFGKKESKRFI
jgi:hypothetical protein